MPGNSSPEEAVDFLGIKREKKWGACLPLPTHRVSGPGFKGFRDAGYYTITFEFKPLGGAGAVRLLLLMR